MVLPTPNTYKVTFTVSDYVSGDVKWGFSSTTASPFGTPRTANGTYTEYFTHDSNTVALRFRASSTFEGSVTNISVKEVGMDWDLGSGWSIAENKAIQDGTGSGISGWLRQQPLTIGKTYTFSCYVETSDVGVVGSVNDNWTSFISFNNGSGEYTTTFTPQSTEINFAPQPSKSYSVTNISVIEITDDTNLPRINYENFSYSYQDALGSELILNGDFSNGSTDWILGQGWSVSDDKAVANTTGNTNGLWQPNTLVSGKTYKATFEVVDYVSGDVRVNVGGPGGAVGNLRSANGTYTEYITSDGVNFYIQGRNSFIGSIDNVSVKEYFGQEVVPNSGCGSWLWEPQSTNVITQSETFSDWISLGGRSQITINNAISPDGTQNASKLEQILATGDASIRFTGLTVGVEYTFSLYAKKGNHETLQLDISDILTVFTLTDDWVRYEITETATANFVDICIKNAVVGSYFYIWGAQVEVLPYATSYIPTSGSTVTRNQDVCNNGGSLSTINSTEGTLYFEGAALANSVVIQRLSLSDGTNSNRVYLQNSTTNNQIFVSVVSGGVSSVNASTTAYDIAEFNKIAIKYKANDFALWINGIEVATDTNAVMPIGLNELAYDDGNGGLQYFGKTKALAVWKEALSDSELQSLTTI
jgi:hypothetical protein